MDGSLPPAPLRVAYLTSQYPATSHTFIRREVSALRRLGATIETFSVRPPSTAELRAAEDQAEAVGTYTLLRQPLWTFLRAHLGELARAPISYFRNLRFALKHRAPGLRTGLLALAHFAEAMLLAAELRRRAVRHVHNHFANSAATVGLLASRQVGAAWSFTVHGVSEFDYPAGVTLAEKIAAATFVACVSYFGRAQAERLVDPVQWPKLHIVRCGLELDRLPLPKDRTEGCVRVVAVGRLSPEKGFAGLLQAFSELPRQANVVLDLVGDGPLLTDLKHVATELGIGERMRFLGRLPEDETLQVIANGDMLVLSSFMEGLPIVLMEALALGKPVIASRVAGIPELVKEGETGVLFAPSNWAELASVLHQLVSDGETRRSMGERGPDVIAREFDINQSARSLYALFQSHGPSESNASEHPN